jgi:uncharacterized phage protein gp47/JayE
MEVNVSFSRPTLSEIINRIKSDIVSRIIGATTLLRRSILTVMSYAYAGAVHLLYGNIEYNKDQLFILTADTESLEKHANEYGISRTASTKATGTATATGTDAIIIPQFTELQSATGQVYLTDTAEVISGGIATLDLTAKVAGDEGNDDGSISLTFVSPISGIITTTTASSAGFDGGADEETDEALRARVLARKRQPPHGGTETDYVAWMKEVSGVTRAWCLPLYQGLGTIGCAFVRDGDPDILPSDAEVATVKAYVISHADPITGKTVGIPVTAEENLYMIDLENLAVNFTISIYPNNGDTQAAVLTQLQDLIKVDGGPAETIRLSRIRAAISAAVGEEYHNLDYPIADITASTNQLHRMGTITFQNYGG